MNTEKPNQENWWKRRNWWKIGFFVMLFLFEGTREIAVLGTDAEAAPNVTFRLFRYEDFTSAEGIWHRTDKDDKMAATTIKVECEQTKRSCTMVDTHMDQLYVFAPNINTFDAQFTPDSITFDDDRAECATLKFRVDLKLKKVNAIREKKPGTEKIEMCNEMEDRIDLTLGSSGYSKPDIDKHFLPLLSSLVAISKLF